MRRERAWGAAAAIVMSATAAQASTIDSRAFDSAGALIDPAGQTFLADSNILDTIGFIVRGSPQGFILAEVYATSGGLPTGAPLWTSAPTFISTPLNIGDPVFQPLLPITAGQTYAIVVRHSSGAFSGYGWQAAGTIPNGQMVRFTGGVWAAAPVGADLAVLIVMNPEPGTLALYGLGLAGLGAAVRRRRRRAATK